MAQRQHRSRGGTRAPFAARLPRPIKRSAGRAGAASTPANVRVFGVDLDADERAGMRERLGRKLGKYARSIERVTVRLRDVNGPRGGVDHVCTIKVVLAGLPSVVFEKSATTVGAAFSLALAGAERAVVRSLQRRRSGRT
jgi:hypothetical protein